MTFFNVSDIGHRVKYGLDHFLDHFLDYFLDHFLDHFIGGKHTISTQGGVGCSLLVLREGWKAECYYSGRGERRTIAGQERWEVDVIVNTTCYCSFYSIVQIIFGFSTDFLNVLHFCRHTKAKLPRKH